jgi:single-strand DNA-binding protein
MSDNTITVSGNVTRDPQLKFLNSGQASVQLGVAVNRRWQNRQSQEWEESTSFFDVVAYGPLAENVAISLGRGDRVVVTGRLEQRSYETVTGEKRNAFEINADEIAPSLKWATASVLRTPRSETNGYTKAAPVTYAFDEEPPF